jgi:hypothetical protein
MGREMIIGTTLHPRGAVTREPLRMTLEEERAQGIPGVLLHPQPRVQSRPLA